MDIDDMTQSIRTDSKVIIINPLGAALQHYANELKQVLETCQRGQIDVLSINEPSYDGTRRALWVISYLKLVRAARRRQQHTDLHVFVTWPLFGFLDRILLALTLREAHLVVHDTRPLVPQKGYGRMSQWIAGLAPRRIKLIVHSHAALSDVRDTRLQKNCRILPHPVLLKDEGGQSPATESIAPHKRPTVRVIGQYKADRDITSMQVLSTAAQGRYTFQVFGRGWPQIDGWEVHDGFLTEDQLATLLRTSDCLVIPYTRFYQSGIAVRALENCVPVIGPSVDSLRQLVGQKSPLLVLPGEGYIQSLTEALQLGRDSTRLLLDDYRRCVQSQWENSMTEHWLPSKSSHE